MNEGTDKDVDYYHRTLDKDKTGGIDLEMTGPPLDKWTNANSKGNRAVAPPPVLEPVGVIIGDNMSEQDFLVRIWYIYEAFLSSLLSSYPALLFLLLRYIFL